MVKLADTRVLEALAERLIGSSPIPGTRLRLQRKLSSAALAKKDIYQLLVEDGFMIRRFSRGQRKVAAWTRDPERALPMKLNLTPNPKAPFRPPDRGKAAKRENGFSV